MASTTASRKNKGRKLQQHVASKILELYPELTERDVVSVPMGMAGDDIRLSELGSNLFPFSVECKNQEKLSIWAALDQSSKTNRELTPLLVFKRNRSDVYCALKFDDFLKLAKKSEKNEEKEK